jgi:DNA helicase-2/ATP-dependent DNA helicase PcrA
MSLSADELASIESEEVVFKNVLTSLASQLVRAEDRLYQENQRARAITSEIHETRRVEDKAQLASDEGVSHGLKDLKRDEVENLKKQLQNPYFARIKLEEEQPNGTTSAIEYKLGFAANTDLRIIDWRRAPISKLYYEYQEGSEYVEEILGRERVGKVVLRTRVESEKGRLKTIQNRHGTFRWNPANATWEGSSSGAARTKASDGQLPEILALITAEQFRSITVDADTAVLIQGIAGSGKTTVALHRLAWLLHSDNSALEPRDCGFIVLSPALRAYVENSLPSVGISGINVRTYHEWACRTFKTLQSAGEFTIPRPHEPSAISMQRVKRSLAILKAIEATIAPLPMGSPQLSFTDLQQDLLRVLQNAAFICSFDDTRLLDEDLVSNTYAATARNFAEGVYDWNDDALLLRIYQLRKGGVLNERHQVGHYGHIFVDEVQDLSPVELATIIASVKHHKDMTLVGDTSQNLDHTQAFPGWDALRKHWNFNEEMSKYISLEVSHRSTLPIMRLADHIQRRDLVRQGRSGRTPIWFKCRDESQGIEHVLKWLTKAGELYPTKIAAVICATPQEARFAYSMLTPTFGPRVRLGDAYSFSFEEGILVTDVRQVKGLEFFSVLLWNPSTSSYGSSDLANNLLYVAVTRAEENLCIVTWDRPARSLPTFGASKLIRSNDMTIQDEEPNQEDD